VSGILPQNPVADDVSSNFTGKKEKRVRPGTAGNRVPLALIGELTKNNA